MIMLQGVAVGILLYCHYFIWQHTNTLRKFLFYALTINVVGALMGIPAGLWMGKAIKQGRQEKARQTKLKEMYPRPSFYANKSTTDPD